MSGSTSSPGTPPVRRDDPSLSTGGMAWGDSIAPEPTSSHPATIEVTEVRAGKPGVYPEDFTAAPAEQRPPWSFRFPGKDKVAIVGFAQTTRHLAPFHDPSFEIWSLNNAYIFLPERPHADGRIAERWFEVHSEDLYGWELRRPGPHVHWMSQFPGPMYLMEARADMPRSISFPIDEAVQWLQIPYLTSTPAYMLALAMMEGFKEIHIYGIDLATESEYADQRPNLEWLIGLALGRGHTIQLPPGTHLLTGDLYGRGKHRPGGEKHTREAYEQRIGALQRRLSEVQIERKRLEREEAKLEGAILDCQHWIGRTPAGQPQQDYLAAMAGPGRMIVEAKGGGGIGKLA